MAMRTVTLPHLCRHLGVALVMLQQNHRPAPIPGLCPVGTPVSVVKAMMMLSFAMKTQRQLECSIATA